MDRDVTVTAKDDHIFIFIVATVAYNALGILLCCKGTGVSTVLKVHKLGLLELITESTTLLLGQSV